MANKDQPQNKRRKLQVDEHSEEHSNTTMEQFPEEVMAHIISFLCDGSIKDIAYLFGRFGKVSKFCRRSSIRFPQLVSVTWYDEELSWVAVRTYRMVAFLCQNHTKVESFGVLNFVSDLDVNIILYMMEKCNISCLLEVNLAFEEGGYMKSRERGFKKSSDYEKTVAIAAGIPEDVVFNQNIGVLDAQRQIANILAKRARCIKVLTLYAPGFHNFYVHLPKFISSSLEKMNLNFGFEDSPPSYALSHTIEALPRLKHLSLFLRGDIPIRSKSLVKLHYCGDEGPNECICPVLEAMTLAVREPGTSKLLSKFLSHTIKKFNLEISSDSTKSTDERWHAQNATFRYTQIIKEMSKLKIFTMWDDMPSPTHGTHLKMKIRSASLQNISIVKSSVYFRIQECICPRLELLRCAFFDPSKTCHLLVTNNESTKDIYKHRKTSIKSVNCPCVGVEVPDDCTLIFKRDKDSINTHY